MSTDELRTLRASELGDGTLWGGTIPIRCIVSDAGNGRSVYRVEGRTCGGVKTTEVIFAESFPENSSSRGIRREE